MSDFIFNMTTSVIKTIGPLGPKNIITLKMHLFNSAKVDYFIGSMSFGRLDPKIKIHGPSIIHCGLTWDADYSDSNALRIPSEGCLDSDDLPLSGVCYFTGAAPGRYTVQHSSAIKICMDEKLQFCLEEPMNLSGKTSFDLS